MKFHICLTHNSYGRFSIHICFRICEAYQWICELKFNIHLRSLFIVLCVLIGNIQRVFVINGHAFSEKVIHHQVKVWVYEQLDTSDFNFEIFVSIGMHLNLHFKFSRVWEFIIANTSLHIIEILNCMKLLHISKKNMLLTLFSQEKAAYFFSLNGIIMSSIQMVINDDLRVLESQFCQLFSSFSHQTQS